MNHVYLGKGQNPRVLDANIFFYLQQKLKIGTIWLLFEVTEVDKQIEKQKM